LFVDNAEEYIRRDIEGSDVDTRRRAACDLVKVLSRYFEGKITEIFGSYVQVCILVLFRLLCHAKQFFSVHARIICIYKFWHIGALIGPLQFMKIESYKGSNNKHDEVFKYVKEWTHQLIKICSKLHD
jgi:hypothetical protein